MDKPEEKHDAAAIEQAVPGSDVAVEEVTLPSGEPAEVAVIEGAGPSRPHDEGEMGYRLGRLETRIVKLEEEKAALEARLAAFEAATVGAIEAEAEAIAEQGEVVADVAEEVLPKDHEAATSHNPSHGDSKCSWWEQIMGGSPHPRRGGS